MAKANGNRGSAPVIEPYGDGADEMRTAPVADAKLPDTPPEVNNLKELAEEPIDGKPKMVTLTLELPIGVLSNGYLSREVTTVTMNGREATAFNMLLNGLDQSDARLDDGTHVGAEKAKLVRWIMAKVANAIGL